MMVTVMVIVGDNDEKYQSLSHACIQCSDTAVIYFDDVRVPAKNIIGEEGGLPS